MPNSLCHHLLADLRGHGGQSGLCMPNSLCHHTLADLRGRGGQSGLCMPNSLCHHSLADLRGRGGQFGLHRLLKHFVKGVNGPPLIGAMSQAVIFNL